MSLVQPVSEALRDAYVACHSEGHQWRHEGRVGGSEPGARPPHGMTDAVARRSVCTSCTSERFRYHYADGYLHRKATPDDDAAPTRQWWRQQLVVTLFEDMTPRAEGRRRRAS